MKRVRSRAQASKPRRAGFHAGRMLRKARLFVGLTQVELGERLGICKQRVSEYESQGNVTTATLVKLGDAMGLELGYRRKP